MNTKIIYQGLIANAISKPFLGQIQIDKITGLITKVLSLAQGRLGDPDKSFTPNQVIFPGMLDIHIHAREDQTGKQIYKEDYTTTANAALQGGVVGVMAMPNTPKPLTTKEDLDWHENRIKEISHPVNILNYIGIGVGTSPVGKPGEHAYKAYFGKSIGDLTFYDEKQLEDALKLYQGHHISFHVEYEPVIEKSSQGRTHSHRRPVECVERGLDLLLPLIEKYGITAKLCHWSTGGNSFRQIEEHRNRAIKQGLPYTTLEVSPLHLLFDTTMTDQDPSLWMKIQMNPAIQSKQDRLQLIEGLKNGFVDYLATDHAPHTLEEKYKAFSKFQTEYPNKSNQEIADLLKTQDLELFKETCCNDNTSGAPWLDTYANVAAHLIHNEKFSYSDIARVTAYNPGNFLNKFLKPSVYGKGYGLIEKDYIGSLTVVDLDAPQKISKENFKTKSGWSPLEGWTLPGKVESVIIRGKDVTNQFKL